MLLSAQNGEELFKSNCAACHSIGNGKLVGPDLKNIGQRRNLDWFIRFVKNSTDLIKSGDKDAVQIASEYNNILMPPSLLANENIKAIFQFINNQSDAANQTVVVAPDYLISSNDSNVINGFELFIGLKPLKNGGVSCISCHNVDQYGSGGTFAKNLTHSFNNLQAAGIRSMISSPAFPAMINSYQLHRIADAEVYDLTSFLRATAMDDLPNDYLFHGNEREHFYLWSILGLVLFTFLFTIIYKTRKTKSVNEEIIKRQIKTQE